MNTIIFSDEVERQYFIEDLHIRGFTKDKARSNDYAITYINKDLPSYHVVVHVQNMTADLYDTGKLVKLR